MAYSNSAAVAGTGGIHGRSSSFSHKVGAKDVQNIASFQEEDTKNLSKRGLTAEKFLEAMEKAEQIVKTFNRQLRFQLREEAGFFQVEVLDLNDEKKVIRKIPPDNVVNFVAHIRDMLGAMIDINA